MPNGAKTEGADEAAAIGRAAAFALDPFKQGVK